mmetsp:Transcript_44147/g.58590  ORF Transcript_44147/g.58590 Transcript_44147/m.58590 type:complete len:93 (+) Transcript_44147:585-863(+)
MKSETLYMLYGRTTLEYDPLCSKPITDAIDTLYQLKAAVSFDYESGVVQATWISSLVMMLLLIAHFAIQVIVKKAGKETQAYNLCNVIMSLI